MFSRKDGIWSIRLGENRAGLQVRAPRYHSPYSERNGFSHVLVSLVGWRLLYLPPRETRGTLTA